eukprot:2161404-Pyramimonas_sp.AAC.1
MSQVHSVEEFGMRAVDFLEGQQRRGAQHLADALALAFALLHVIAKTSASIPSRERDAAGGRGARQGAKARLNPPLKPPFLQRGLEDLLEPLLDGLSLD